MRLSNKHVLIARAVDNIRGGYRRILVFSDVAEVSDPVLEMATAVASPGATIDVQYCCDFPPASYPYCAPALSTRDVATWLRERMPVGAAEFDDESPGHHRGRSVSRPWSERHDRYDLIVIGSHGHSGPARRLLGSVAEFTVHYSPCSVLVVHEEGRLRGIGLDLDEGTGQTWHSERFVT
ncbi:MAG: universal stress protein [Proteobacteria bacterium]|nr:universal stress protein [Pseudomonadota bacterium]